MLGIYRVEYKGLCDLNYAEAEFLEEYFAITDDTTKYFIDKDSIEGVIQQAKENKVEIPWELINELKEELKKNPDGYDIMIF